MAEWFTQPCRRFQFTISTSEKGKWQMGGRQWAQFVGSAFTVTLKTAHLSVVYQKVIYLSLVCSSGRGQERSHADRRDASHLSCGAVRCAMRTAPLSGRSTLDAWGQARPGGSEGERRSARPFAIGTCDYDLGTRFSNAGAMSGEQGPLFPFLRLKTKQQPPPPLHIRPPPLSHPPTHSPERGSPGVSRRRRDKHLPHPGRPVPCSPPGLSPRAAACPRLRCGCGSAGLLLGCCPQMAHSGVGTPQRRRRSPLISAKSLHTPAHAAKG